MPYPHRGAELLAALLGVALFSAAWFPLARGARGMGPWIEIPVACLPLLLLAAACFALRRRWRADDKDP